MLEHPTASSKILISQDDPTAPAIGCNTREDVSHKSHSSLSSKASSSMMTVLEDPNPEVGKQKDSRQMNSNPLDLRFNSRGAQDCRLF